MRYQLSGKYEFCGYKGLPFGIVNTERGESKFIDRELFKYIYRLASGVDSEELTADERQKAVSEELINGGILTEVADDTPRCIPKYNEYTNRYKERVHWSITGACNAKCKHCFMSAPDAKFGEPTLEQCLDIVRQFKDCGVRVVDITGGEPLIRKDFWDIIDAILDNGLHVGVIYSNGFLVNEKLLDGFESRRIKPSWQISYDGIGCHDWMRGVPGAEKMALDAMKLLVSRGYSVACGYSLFKESAPVLMDSIKLLKEIGVHSMKTGYMQEQGLWLQHMDHNLSKEEHLEFYKKFIPEYLSAGRPINLQIEGLFIGYSPNKKPSDAEGDIEDKEKDKEKDKEYSFFLAKELEPEKHDKCDACESLRKCFYIGASGNVVPCMGLDGTPAMEGSPNVFETPLKDILTESAYTKFAYASVLDVERHNPECKDCEYKYKCCAGCRAMAVGDDGNDYLALDPRTCMMLKEDWTGQIVKAIDEANK